MRGIINGLFISIHAPHAGRDARCKSNTHRINISIHAPHAGRDPANSSTTAPCREHFNPRAPCGARRLKLLLWCRTIHFNPRAPCGARQRCRNPKSSHKIFQSTRPMRGATRERDNSISAREEISIHAPHAGRDKVKSNIESLQKISIHAPHAGRDQDYRLGFENGKISIHAPHAGRDSTFYPSNPQDRIFQSTRPMRGATGISVQTALP